MMDKAAKEHKEKEAARKKEFIELLQNNVPNVDVVLAMECYEEVIEGFRKENPGVVNPPIPIGSDLSAGFAVKTIGLYLKRQVP